MMTRGNTSWSNRSSPLFTRPRSSTGPCFSTRVSLQNHVLPNPDSAAPLNRLDGFSVIGGLAVGFPSPISVRTDPRPATAMRYETDYVAAVLDEVTDASGTPLTSPRRVKVALGLEKPADEAEAEWAAFNVPVRALLTDAQVDLARVLRVWARHRTGAPAAPSPADERASTGSRTPTAATRGTACASRAPCGRRRGRLHRGEVQGVSDS
jgi:hypothetical protein